MKQIAQFERFAALHDEFFILSNAWDAGSARLMAQAGARAIATSSAPLRGHTATPTRGDAAGACACHHPRDCRRVDLPVTADIEAGYAADPVAAADCAAQVVDAGAVGVNIEDGTGAPDLLAAKIEAIKEGPLGIHAHAGPQRPYEVGGWRRVGSAVSTTQSM